MTFLTLDNPSPGTTGEYRIEPARGVRVEEYKGHTTLPDIRSLLLAMASDPCWSASHHGLIDFSGATLDLSANDVLRWALMMRQEENRSHGWLVFVAGNSATYGMVRMLGFWLRGSERVRIFRSRAEAGAWLERNASTRPPGFVEAEERQAAKLRSAI